MIELLECLQASALSKMITTSQSLSNLLLILYCIAYLKNNKGFYLGAFLFTEFIGASSFMDSYSNAQFYVFIASSFAMCYWYETIIGKNIKIMLAYGMMVLFQSMMVLDAQIYTDIVTRIYQAYEFVIVGIHIYIITVLIKPRSLLKALGDSINRLSDFLGVGYNLSFCYTVHILLK